MLRSSDVNSTGWSIAVKANGIIALPLAGSMINAEKYTVRIVAEDAEGVAIGGVDVP